MKKKAKAVRVKEEDSQQSRPLKTERVEEVVMSSLEGRPSLSTRREDCLRDQVCREAILL